MTAPFMFLWQTSNEIHLFLSCMPFARITQENIQETIGIFGFLSRKNKRHENWKRVFDFLALVWGITRGNLGIESQWRNKSRWPFPRSSILSHSQVCVNDSILVWISMQGGTWEEVDKTTETGRGGQRSLSLSLPWKQQTPDKRIISSLSFLSFCRWQTTRNFLSSAHFHPRRYTQRPLHWHNIDKTCGK